MDERVLRDQLVPGASTRTKEGENAMGARVVLMHPQAVGPLPPVSDSSQTAQLLTNLLLALPAALHLAAPPASSAQTSNFTGQTLHTRTPTSS